MGEGRERLAVVKVVGNRRLLVPERKGSLWKEKLQIYILCPEDIGRFTMKSVKFTL